MTRTPKKTKCTREVSYLLLYALAFFASLVIVSSSVIIFPSNNLQTNNANQTFTCNFSTNVALTGAALRVYADNHFLNFLGENSTFRARSIISDIVNSTGLKVVADSSRNIYVKSYQAVQETENNTIYSFFLQKYNAEGSLLWNEIIGSYNHTPSSDSAFTFNVITNLAIDSLGNSYVIWSAATNLYFLKKYDSHGNLLFNKSFENTSLMVYSLAVDKSNNVYITGYSNLLGTPDLIIQKHDFNGTILWNQSYGVSQEDVGFSIAFDSFDNVYVGGLTQGSGEAEHSKGLILEYTPAGDLILNQTLDYYELNDAVFDIAVNSQGEIYAFGIGNQKEVLFEMNREGQLVWGKILNNSLGDVISFDRLALDSSDNIYLTTYSHEEAFYDSIKSSFEKYNPQGDLIYQDTLGIFYEDYQEPAEVFLAFGLASETSSFSDNVYFVGAGISDNTIRTTILTYSPSSATKAISGTETSASWQLTLPHDGIYLWSCAGLNQSSTLEIAPIYSLTLDTAPPEMVLGQSIQILDNETLAFNLNATDPSGVDSFYFTDYGENIAPAEDYQDRITINKTGFVTNISYLEPGAYAVSFDVNDSLGNIGRSYFLVQVLNHTTSDGEYPQVNSFTENPANGTIYAPGQRYQLAANVTDNFDIKEVKLYFYYIGEEYSNGVIDLGLAHYFSFPSDSDSEYPDFLNLTKEGDIYSAELADLQAGVYFYIYTARDTGGMLNGLGQLYYTISKAAPSLNINFSSGNSVTHGAQTIVSGTGCPSPLACSLKRGSLAVSNPDTQTLAPGIYTYTYSTSGNANYTSYTKTATLTINPQISSDSSSTLSTPVQTNPATPNSLSSSRPSHDHTTTTVPSNNFIASESQLNAGYSAQLGENGGISFTLSGESHFMQLRQFSADQITLLVASNPITLTLNSGESKKLDINADNVYELFVRYDGLSGGKASIYVSKISEPVPSTTSTSSGKTSLTPLNRNASTNSINNTALIIIILCAAIAIVIILLVVILSLGRRRPRDRRFYSYNEHVNQNNNNYL